jgi:hypothetical protein
VRVRSRLLFGLDLEDEVGEDGREDMYRRTGIDLEAWALALAAGFGLASGILTLVS